MNEVDLMATLKPVLDFVAVMCRGANGTLADDTVVAPVWDYHGRSRLTLGALRRLAATVKQESP